MSWFPTWKAGAVALSVVGIATVVSAGIGMVVVGLAYSAFGATPSSNTLLVAKVVGVLAIAPGAIARGLDLA